MTEETDAPSAPKGPRSGSTLTADEHLLAEELIGELQDRMMKLQDMGDEHIEKAKKRGYASNYDPDSWSIQFGDSIIVIKLGQGRISASHNGKDVLRIFSMKLDLIDFEGLRRALRGVRNYMILDDLANV